MPSERDDRRERGELGGELVRRRQRGGVRLALPVEGGQRGGAGQVGATRLLPGQGELVAGGVERLGRLRGPDRRRAQPLVGQHEVGADGGDGTPGVGGRRLGGRHLVRARQGRSLTRSPSPVADAAGEVSSPATSTVRASARQAPAARCSHVSSPANGVTSEGDGLRGPRTLPWATRSTLMRSRHRRNSFHRIVETPRRVALTNHTHVIRRAGRNTPSSTPSRQITLAQLPLGGEVLRLLGGWGVFCLLGSRGVFLPARRQSSSATGTSEVSVVGWEERPCRSNFCPDAMPPR